MKALLSFVIVVGTLLVVWVVVKKVMAWSKREKITRTIFKRKNKIDDEN